MRFWISLSACLLLFGCAQQAPESESKQDDKPNNEAPAEAGPTAGLGLAPVEGEPAKAAQNVLVHLANLSTILEPLTEHCSEMGRDVEAYYVLAKPDFENLLKATLSDAEKTQLSEAYQTIGTRLGRCLKNDETRQFQMTLINRFKPLWAG